MEDKNKENNQQARISQENFIKHLSSGYKITLNEKSIHTFKWKKFNWKQYLFVFHISLVMFYKLLVLFSSKF